MATPEQSVTPPTGSEMSQKPASGGSVDYWLGWTHGYSKGYKEALDEALRILNKPRTGNKYVTGKPEEQPF